MLSTIRPTAPFPPAYPQRPVTPQARVPVPTPQVPMPTIPIPTAIRTPHTAVPIPTITRGPQHVVPTPFRSPHTPVPVPTVPRAPVAFPRTVAIPRPLAVANPHVPPAPRPAMPRPAAPFPVMTQQAPTKLVVVPRTAGGYVIPQVPVPPKPQPKKINLFDWQVNWANRAHSILMSNHGYIDTSRMRSGKTVVTNWLAQQFGYRLIIVGPVGAVEDGWRREAATYGNEIISYVSYQTLRSKKGFQPKHGLLQRHDNVTEGGNHQVHFIPTQEYLNLIESGVLLVFDEIQNIKNNSDQYKACTALMRPVISGGGRSRFGLLSGTPIDKEEQAVNLLRLIGYIRAPRLYNFDRARQEVILEGAQELIDACRYINAAETDKVLTQIVPNKKTMTHFVYTLYIRVVKSGISGGMAPPTDDKGLYDAKNGFYNVAFHRRRQLDEGVTALAKAVKFDQNTGTVEWKQHNIGKVTPALVQIETAKVDDMARVADKILVADGDNKVVLAFSYINSIETTRVLLSAYNPLILFGDTPAKKRAGVVADFNNDPTRRVLIMNTAVGAEGISLYSQNVHSPRFMLISPSYHFNKLTQAAARIYGPGMISTAVVHTFYGKGAGEQEAKILESIARKTEVLKGVLDDAVNKDLVLPGDYESYYED